MECCGAARTSSVGGWWYPCCLRKVYSFSGVRTSHRLRYCLSMALSLKTHPSLRMLDTSTSTGCWPLIEAIKEFMAMPGIEYRSQAEVTLCCDNKI